VAQRTRADSAYSAEPQKSIAPHRFGDIMQGCDVYAHTICSVSSRSDKVSWRITAGTSIVYRVLVFVFSGWQSVWSHTKVMIIECTNQSS